MTDKVLHDELLKLAKSVYRRPHLNEHPYPIVQIRRATAAPGSKVRCSILHRSILLGEASELNTLWHINVTKPNGQNLKQET